MVSRSPLDSHDGRPEVGISRALVTQLKPPDVDEVAATVDTLRKDLSVGTQTDGRTVELDRAAVVAALDRAPQRYIDAIRVLIAVRREHRRAVDELETRMAEFRRSARAAITADPERKSRAKPDSRVVQDWVATHKETQVRSLTGAVGDADDAVKAAEALVRAYSPATREATLRRFLDDL